ncbi:SIMPL domain-containing protein [Leifsonia sp. LS1]|uniref:SIMPL domain-containing protein n=1 Tax=Leifsonia sp. LS1 TaxID=2828483 RepID=UPI001CFD83EE|nr:SIMPL domain-containing protein [Leifsonia sp. LS1]GIT79480.1 SIMPL domain-containing protein [Leifsonia sp. LS1]
MSETIITVLGEHEQKRTAEHGSVRVRVMYDGSSRHETLALATQRHAELVAGLRELEEAAGGPLLRWSSDQVRVWGDRPWSQSGEQLPIVHHAELGLRAEFAEATAVSDWVSAVTLREGVSVDGVEWMLSDETREALVDEVSRLAVEDAVATARRYASALGLTELRPVALSDPGLLGDAGAPPRSPTPLGARTMSADTAGGALALAPEDIHVAVQVHARFAAS